MMKSTFKTLLASAILTTPMLFGSVQAHDAEEASLFNRLGGPDKIRVIVEDTYHNHVTNPIIRDRFVDSDHAAVKQKVYEIFAAATGSEEIEYTGRDMKTTHRTMNINEMEFNAVVDDVMAALEKNGVGQQEKNEVLAILWSVRGDIVNPNITTQALTDSESSE
ncbi:group I truncated hemoglobin [Methylophaga thiooxydans]|uniref:Protozoan/cyanobacterial globin family protein n=1 Tax=Methylophaga thiooxydans DMS010 TaxID=637616 RepID=C0N294_9GAMM|nr:group 1 truncated hemoglobin [Methylophaga thiooxydans]EEF81207.1 protozoan/cyanobacterial globin family protein [Methylophaga thiooxydans DMS010]